MKVMAHAYSASVVGVVSSMEVTACPRASTLSVLGYTKVARTHVTSVNG